MKKLRKIIKGETLIVSSGEYSDYMVHGLFKALQDFEPEEFLKEYLELNPEEKERYQFEERKFVAFMSSKGVIEDMPNCEFHLGSYGISEDINLSEHD